MGQLTVEVNGRPYVMGCEDGQEARLKTLAAQVDAQVREVARDVGPLGETRLILMGALVMADEMAEMRARLEALAAEVAEAKAEIGRAELRAVAALQSAAEKIEAMAAA